MKLDLEHSDLIRMVRGSLPHESIAYHPVIKRYRHWINEGRGIWLWSSAELGRATEEELWELYILCKNSWENAEEETKEYYPIHKSVIAEHFKNLGR